MPHWERSLGEHRIAKSALGILTAGEHSPRTVQDHAEACSCAAGYNAGIPCHGNFLRVIISSGGLAASQFASAAVSPTEKLSLTIDRQSMQATGSNKLDVGQSGQHSRSIAVRRNDRTCAPDATVLLEVNGASLGSFYHDHVTDTSYRHWGQSILG
jgi:hypothetical protein